jgi:hypothetical protein
MHETKMAEGDQKKKDDIQGLGRGGIRGTAKPRNCRGGKKQLGTGEPKLAQNANSEKNSNARQGRGRDEMSQHRAKVTRKLRQASKARARDRPDTRHSGTLRKERSSSQ